jgi:hypothetical protein
MSFWDGSQWVADRPTAPTTKPESRVKHATAAVLEAGLITALTFGLIAGSAFAAKGGGGCTPAAPRVSVENTWAWADWGSYGMPGQELQFQVSVMNYDVGCGRSTFVVKVSAPEGFAVSLPDDTITLRSGRVGYLSAWVTSPAGAGDGDHPIVASATRSETSDLATAGDSFTSYYKVYSSDSAAPTLYWPSPGDGATVTGRSYNIAVSARDDHAVKWIKLYLDGDLVSTVACDDIAYSCTLHFSWSVSAGQHTATFRSSDWMANITELTSTFTGG